MPYPRFKAEQQSFRYLPAPGCRSPPCWGRRLTMLQGASRELSLSHLSMRQVAGSDFEPRPLPSTFCSMCAFSLMSTAENSPANWADQAVLIFTRMDPKNLWNRGHSGSKSLGSTTMPCHPVLYPIPSHHTPPLPFLSSPETYAQLKRKNEVRRESRLSISVRLKFSYVHRSARRTTDDRNSSRRPSALYRGVQMSEIPRDETAPRGRVPSGDAISPDPHSIFAHTCAAILSRYTPPPFDFLCHVADW
ncbi:hypothetical protein DL768_005796 [Monosporascus sp. mg162]|nr:hypothetical protein DL768_005796 [Monosporascus sp. mg162]